MRGAASLALVITAESGLCLKDSIYEVGRAYDVYSLAGQLAIRDDSEVYSCDITPHGKPRREEGNSRQMVHFFRTGEIIDVCGGLPCGPDMHP